MKLWLEKPAGAAEADKSVPAVRLAARPAAAAARFISRDSKNTYGHILDYIEIQRGEVDAGTARQWRELESFASISPFQQQHWLACWHEHCGRSHAEPVTVTGYRNGRPALLLPMVLERKFGFRLLSWAGRGVNDYCMVIMHPAVRDALDPKAAAGLLADIASRLGGLDMIYLPKQPHVIGGSRNPFITGWCFRHHASTHAVRLGSDWNTYYHDHRGAKSRRRIKDKLAALNRLGPVRFHHAAGGAELAEAVDACLALKQRQLHKLGHWNPLAAEGARRLLINYARNAAPGSVWAVTLEAGGRPAAIAFGFARQDQWLIYQLAMDDGPASRHSPGTHLLIHIMQHCIGTGIARLDLSLGDEPYKMEWCNEHLPLWTSCVPVSAAGRLLAQMLRLRGAARSYITRKPRLHRWAKSLKAVVHSWSRPAPRR